MTTLQQPAKHVRPMPYVKDREPSPAYESRAVTRVRGLGDLMTRRPELAGVYGPADVAAEAFLWSA